MNQKPKLPGIVYLLYVLALCGLIALGIAAFTAFSQVAGWEQALAASILIEAAMVIEGITLIRRNYWAAGGVLISLIVSGTYNFIQAQQAGKLHGLTNNWQLLTLAVGPLSALLFLALTIGHELRKHEERVKAWEADQRKIKLQAQETAKAEQVRRETQDLEEKHRKEEADRNFELQREKLRLEEERKLKVAQARIEARERARNLPETEAKEEAKDAKLSLDWRKVPEEDKRLIAGMTVPEIEQTYGVSKRTAQNWYNWARITPISSNGNNHHGEG